MHEFGDEQGAGQAVGDNRLTQKADLPASSDKRAITSPWAVGFFLVVIVLVTGVDLWFKAWAFAHVANRPVVLTQMAVTNERRFWSKYPHAPIVVVPGVLNLRLTSNPGAVFGAAKGGKWIFIAVSIVAIGVTFVLFARSLSRAWAMHLALGLILAGALGNLYDRVTFSVVRDMLRLFPNTNLWPWIFNLADASLMSGVGLMLVLSLFRDRPGVGASSSSASPTD